MCTWLNHPLCTLQIIDGNEKILFKGKVSGKNICKLLNASFQGVKRLFVLAYSIANGGNDEAGIKKQLKVFSSKRRN